jgi:ABC-type nitrate/sulfonate/bicarbonate transport system permease component
MQDRPLAQRAPPRRSSAFVAKSVPPLALLAAVIIVWALAASRSGLPGFILPSPADVARAGWQTRAALLPALRATLVETGVGLILSIGLAAAIAAAIDLSSLLRRAVYPMLVASQTIQILAIAPLLILWFGFGLTSKVVIVVLICFFPLTLSMADGLASADPDLVALFRAMGATRRQIWRLIRLPSAARLLLRFEDRRTIASSAPRSGMGGRDGRAGAVHAAVEKRLGYRPGFRRHFDHVGRQHRPVCPGHAARAAGAALVLHASAS